ncbi:MAG: hypothetical protein IKN04_02410 [Clostridia bacterium]|nr:hypothetical protein [Clostridia bacterium]MBR6186075.1 hypothetical protein [Clostridia bacterium]
MRKWLINDLIEIFFRLQKQKGPPQFCRSGPPCAETDSSARTSASAKPTGRHIVRRHFLITAHLSRIESSFFENGLSGQLPISFFTEIITYFLFSSISLLISAVFGI